MMIEGEKIENSLIEILVSSTKRVKYGKDVLLLLVLLVNYRKYKVFKKLNYNFKIKKIISPSIVKYYFL